MRSADGEIIDVHEACLYNPRKGDIAEFYSAGGGGYGDPYERAVDAVVDDVVAGTLSAEKALEDYGVVVDPDSLTVDRQATATARKGRRQAGR
jgi:N-methylhydantoinase B